MYWCDELRTWPRIMNMYIYIYTWSLGDPCFGDFDSKHGVNRPKKGSFGFQVRVCVYIDTCINICVCVCACVHTDLTIHYHTLH